MSKSRAKMMNPLFRRGFGVVTGMGGGTSWETARDKLGYFAKPSAVRESQESQSYMRERERVVGSTEIEPFVLSEVETFLRAKSRKTLGCARPSPSTSLGKNGEGSEVRALGFESSDAVGQRFLRRFDFSPFAGYTNGMKVAVSIPDPVFDEAEELARKLKTSRSEIYARALAAFIGNHAPDRVTQAMNDAVDAIGAPTDAFADAAARRVLTQTEW